jgi:hypothetical protein
MMKYNLLSLLLVLPPVLQAESFTIISSTSPNYSVDTALAADQKIHLSKGQKIQLKSKHHQYCVLNGPYNAKPNCSHLAQRIARFTPKQRSNDQHAPIWAIDSHRAGITCYDPNIALQLWRQNANQAEYINITNRYEPDQQTKLSWARGESELAWPNNALPLSTEGDYLLQFDQRTTLISLRALPNDLKTKEDKTIWMAQQGCKWQLQQILKTHQAQ